MDRFPFNASFPLIFHLCPSFPSNACIAVHKTGTGDFVIAEFYSDRIQSRIKLLGGRSFSQVSSKKDSCSKGIVGKPCQGYSDQAERLAFPGFLKKFPGICVDFICDICGIGKFHLMRFIPEIQGSEGYGYAGALFLFTAHAGCQDITLFQQDRKYLFKRNNIINKCCFYTKTFCFIRLGFYRRIVQASGILVKLLASLVTQKLLDFGFLFMSQVSDRFNSCIYEFLF